MDSPKLQFWERREDETARAYEAFCVYRDLGPLRSLRKAAELFYTGKPTVDHRQFERWSSASMWVARCDAYDAEVDRERRVRLEKERVDHLDRAAKMGRWMQAIAASGLREIEGTKTIRPPMELVNYLRAGIAEERRALGLPTEAVILEHRQADPHDPEGDRQDDPYTRVTDAMRRFGR